MIHGYSCRSNSSNVAKPRDARWFDWIFPLRALYTREFSTRVATNVSYAVRRCRRAVIRAFVLSKGGRAASSLFRPVDNDWWNWYNSRIGIYDVPRNATRPNITRVISPIHGNSHPWNSRREEGRAQLAKLHEWQSWQYEFNEPSCVYYEKRFIYMVSGFIFIRPIKHALLKNKRVCYY